MRHRKSGRKLGVTASHRKQVLNALSTALLRSKKIRTTVAKAKETRMMVEKIITRAKNAVAENDKIKSVHAHRQVFRFIKDRAVVTELFTEIAPKVAERKGGYTRIIKLGQRHGDGAELAILELVDFQTAEKQTKEEKQKDEKKAQAEKKTKAEKKKDFKPGAVTDH
ncbi:MAG: 50S ribosomal protein L17 [Bacteroidota bacterium]